MSEHHEQSAVVNWFRYQYRQYALCFFAIQNAQMLSYLGNKQKIAQVYNKLKREGFKEGVSDLILTVPRGQYHGLWLEMKDRGKTQSSVSKDQKAHLALMSEMGYAAHWAPGFEKAQEILINYMNLGEFSL